MTTGPVGYIYILTNPSFPDYVKIGFAHNVDQRLTQLNRSECIPYAFRVYALYEVHKKLQDKEVHKLIDGLNPALRSIEKFKGKDRIREFYALSPEDAYELLHSIAKISGTEDRLTRTTPTGEVISDEAMAETIRETSKERREVFNFEKCGIKAGEEITFLDKPEIVATVIDDRFIRYQGERTSLSRSARDILDVNHPVQGTLYWTYNGVVLNEIRCKLEEKGEYVSDCATSVDASAVKEKSSF